MRIGEPLTPDDRVGGGHHSVASSQTGGWVSEHRPAEPSREVEDLCRIAAVPTTHQDQSSAAQQAVRKSALRSSRSRLRRGLEDGRQRPGSADQRLAERQIEMDGARPTPIRPEGSGEARRRERTPRRGIGVIRRSGVGRRAHRPTEEVDLVDRLRGADTAQFGRAIGRAHKKRHVGEIGLHDRGMQVHRRGPTGAEHESRPAVDRKAERHEGRRALVEDDMTGDTRFGDQSERERRAARPGSDYRGVQSGGRPLVNQCRAEGGVRGHAPDDTCHTDRT